VKFAESPKALRPLGLQGPPAPERVETGIGFLGPRRASAVSGPHSGTHSKGCVLVVDDIDDNLRLMEIMLERAGYEVRLAESGREALQMFGGRRPDLCLVDLQMPEMDGITLLRELRRIDPDVPAIVVTAFGSIEAAVEAMKAGAVDFLTKPVRRDQVVKLVGQHVGNGSRVTPAAGTARGAARAGQPIARSPMMLRVLGLAAEAAGSDATVLITGESGVGKEVVARFIHERSEQRGGPFFALNCAAINESLVESELFGYERGAFTGADRRKAGLLEQAASGTLLLDEIGDMPVVVQAKLLRVIETREMIPVGGTQPVQVKARLIAATNADLRQRVETREFREDLFFRLNVFTIEIPPLRERREDILPLALHVLERIAQESNKDLPGLSQDAVDYLTMAPWKGNVRELVNAIERAAIVSRGSLITAADFPRDTSLPVETGVGFSAPLGPLPAGGTARLEDIERRVLVDALERSGFNVSRAARVLGMGRGALRYRMQKHGIEVDD
jgi:two-component system, NtrC family, response regulator AtoC